MKNKNKINKAFHSQDNHFKTGVKNVNQWLVCDKTKQIKNHRSKTVPSCTEICNGFIHIISLTKQCAALTTQKWSNKDAPQKCWL